MSEVVSWVAKDGHCRGSMPEEEAWAAEVGLIGKIPMRLNLGRDLERSFNPVFNCGV